MNSTPYFYELKIKVFNNKWFENKSKQLNKQRIKMSYLTHNEIFVNPNGTSLKGNIKCGYYLLVTLFGQPHKADEYKSDAGWDILFLDDDNHKEIRATIYNWKDGFNYCGANGIQTDKITDWHVGGNHSSVVSRIQEVIDTYILDCLENTITNSNKHFEEA